MLLFLGRLFARSDVFVIAVSLVNPADAQNLPKDETKGKLLTNILNMIGF